MFVLPRMTKKTLFEGMCDATLNQLQLFKDSPFFYLPLILPDGKRWVIAGQQHRSRTVGEQLEHRRQRKEEEKETCGQAEQVYYKTNSEVHLKSHIKRI